MPDLFDVIEVESKKPHRVRVLASGRTKMNAEHFIEVAVRRRGVEEHFFTSCRVGEYRDGDHLKQAN